MMRHYLWGDATGRLCGMAWGYGGWDGDPLNNPPENSRAKSTRDYMLSQPGGLLITQGAAFDCGCAVDDDTCVCDQLALGDYYIDGGALVAKPAMTILVDGVPYTDDGAVSIPKVSGSPVSVQIQAAVPNGHQITLTRAGAQVIDSDPVLTFADSESNTIVLTAPGLGELGGVMGVDKYLRSIRVPLLGA